MPYPGMITTLRACSSSCAAPSTVSCFHSFCSPAARAGCAFPNAPNRTFVNERFMARHMMIERMRPLDPSSAPAVTSSLLSRTNPIATADRHDEQHTEDQRERRDSEKRLLRPGRPRMQGDRDAQPYREREDADVDD